MKITSLFRLSKNPCKMNLALSFDTQFLILMNFHLSQGCGISMPDLSDSRLLVGGQVDFTRGIVRGQVNF